MLVDEAKIKITAGRGGDGAISFRHEKYVDRGGPDGGDGGDGGDIIFQASNRTNTLTDFERLREYKAGNGQPGSKNRRHGKNGQDLILYVPVGTIIHDLKNNSKVADLKKEGDKVVAVEGGKGGLGNVHFATATHQTPREAKPGEPGCEKDLYLVLKLIADVGLIGLPNAGKSTLISVVSNAKPKIASYPFTTLEPILGVVSYDGKSFVVADIPGLIEKASEGKGLGHKFLRHTERTKVLVHLIDSTSDNLEKDYKIIRNELEKFSPELSRKKEVIVLSKIDLIDKFPKKFKYDFAISSATGKGINQLVAGILKNI